VHRFLEIAGATLHAEAAYSILRGMKTLALRMARHNANALAIAEYLAGHPKVADVYYPGLANHPDHAIARRQMKGFGGVLSFVPRGEFAELRTVLNGLRLAQRAAHLGGVATTAGPPSVTSHVELTAEERARAGIPETLIRYSVGIEDPADLIADLDQALAAI
jgi:cystathionine gamma-synthase